MGERFWKPNTSSKGLLIFNQGDTLAEEVDCNVWEGECARGDDSSMQRWSCQVSGWLILASEVGAGCEQECRPPWRRVPSIRVVTPTLCWLDRMGRWIREGQLRHVPRPKVQTMDFVHLSAWRQKPFSSSSSSSVFISFLSMLLCYVYIPQMFNILVSRWLFEEVVYLSVHSDHSFKVCTEKVPRRRTARIPQYTVHCVG